MNILATILSTFHSQITIKLAIQIKDTLNFFDETLNNHQFTICISIPIIPILVGRLSDG